MQKYVSITGPLPRAFLASCDWYWLVTFNLPLTATSGRASCHGVCTYTQGGISGLNGWNRPTNRSHTNLKMLLGIPTGTASVHLSLHPYTRAWPSPSPPAWDYTLFLVDPCDSSVCNFNYIDLRLMTRSLSLASACFSPLCRRTSVEIFSDSPIYSFSWRGVTY